MGPCSRIRQRSRSATAVIASLRHTLDGCRSWNQLTRKCLSRNHFRPRTGCSRWSARVNQRVLVLADLVADRFITGTKRISREAPVLILSYQGER
jgi:hypothetical protein